MERADYLRFLRGLKEFNINGNTRLDRTAAADEMRPRSRQKHTALTSILAYVLMKNHIHLLLYCINEEKMSLFLQKIFVGHTMYFNTKYQRTGVLFQGRSKSKHIDDDHYLKHLIDYIHLNPLDYSMPQWREHGIKNSLSTKNEILNYPWSSAKSIINNKPNPILNGELVRELFPHPKELLTSALEWSSEKFEDAAGLLIEP
ncbi:MAG: hypothetical protein Q8Q46_01965 [Candidatus Giovannonibacteria bacterium]|nr:hypothetical protein [Candidatus Giovannonibacteria bacterium]